MRLAVLLLLVSCGKAAPRHDEPPQVRAGSAAGSAGSAATASAGATRGSGSASDVAVVMYDDLGAALKATIPEDARVVGFGELHSRTDRAQIRSTISRFTTEALPAIQDKLSDLVIETWIVDKGCGKQATEATAKMQITMRRPMETKSEIAVLADTARAAGIQPHAMRVTCDDYTRIAPPGKEVDPIAMLTLTTKELGRIATEAVLHRDKEPTHKPWIALYGGALHNDRFPEAAVADWSYAAKIDEVSTNRFVEIDIIAPELAETDPAIQKLPWFSVVKTAGTKLQVWKRGERSFVIVLPRAPSEPAAPHPPGATP